MNEKGNQNSKTKPSLDWDYLGSVFALLVIVISICMLVSLPIAVKPNMAFGSSYRSDYRDTALTFFHAMRTNNIEFAKGLVSDDNLSRLDEWADNREGFCYPIIWAFTNQDPFEDPLESYSSGNLVDEYSANYGAYEVYRKSNRGVYELSINDIELRLIDDKWVVTDWGEISESRDEKYKRRCRCINISRNPR